MSYQGTKRSKSCRIYEYFNEEMAKIRPKKTGSDYTLHPKEIIGIRFNMHDWYIAFRAEYVSGEAITDGDENSEVIWLDVEEALCRDDVANLTKELIKLATSNHSGLIKSQNYTERDKYAPYSFYTSIS